MLQWTTGFDLNVSADSWGLTPPPSPPRFALRPSLRSSHPASPGAGRPSRYALTWQNRPPQAGAAKEPPNRQPLAQAWSKWLGAPEYGHTDLADKPATPAGH